MWEASRRNFLSVISAFYENVPRHKAEQRALRPDEPEENLILEFSPRPAHDMLVACVYSHWTGKDQDDLWSFAFVTDDPPAEVAEAGHDRCIIPIRAENMMKWLQPEKSDLPALYAVLDDRDDLFYEHRLAA